MQGNGCRFMRLTCLRIQNFGKLKEREFFLEDGINIIYGPNESGKSTLHAFIRAMFFGVPRLRGRASRTDLYSKFEPWDRPVDYAGSMYFEAGNKEFCIDRNFYKHDERASLICETDGEELSVEQGDLGILLGGISESVYDNTVSIGQLRAETDEGMLRELQHFMVNYEGSGQGDIDLVKASGQLKRRKKEWEKKLVEARNRQKERRENLENEIAYRNKEIENLKNQVEDVKAEIKCLQISLEEETAKEASGKQTLEKEISEKPEREENTKNRAEKREQKREARYLKKAQREEKRRRSEEAETETPIHYPFMEIMSLLLAVIAGCAIAFFAWWNPYFLQDTIKYPLMIVGIIIVACSVWKMVTVYERHILEDLDEYDDDSDEYDDSDECDDSNECDDDSDEYDVPNACDDGFDEYDNDHGRYDGNDDEDNEDTQEEGVYPGEHLYYDMLNQAQQIERKISRLYGREETLSQQIAEKKVEMGNLRENLEEFCDDTREIRNCKMEIESLNLAMRTLHQLSEKMQRKIGARLQRRMGEILQEITEDRYEQLRVDENINIELFEDGRWVSLQQLSRGTVEQVYFSLRMAVSEILCEEKLPVLLDDVFGMYDEVRLIQTLRWLFRRGGQILIFTCHKREMELLQRMGIRTNVISL